jgi:hypothetical protein
MDTLVILNTCPHPLNNASEYPKKPLRYELYRANERAADDCCEHSCHENERGFKNNALYQLAACGE